MSNGQKFISTLIANGFKKVPWDKCPQGFEKANYPCYSHEGKNIWAEVYLSDSWQYMYIAGNGIEGHKYLGGLNIDDPAKLKEILKPLFKTKRHDTKIL